RGGRGVRAGHAHRPAGLHPAAGDPATGRMHRDRDGSARLARGRSDRAARARTRDPDDMSTEEIALVTYSTKPRGGVVHTLALAEALTAAGTGVHVITLGEAGS